MHTKEWKGKEQKNGKIMAQFYGRKMARSLWQKNHETRPLIVDKIP